MLFLLQAANESVVTTILFYLARPMEYSWVGGETGLKRKYMRFLASRITTVSLPAVGTYLREKQISPNLFSCTSNKVCYRLLCLLRC
ncbi:hypothetical protein L798_13823 [Zootermopsis nevadensis]|uniref:Uncharacterized protein n=1 Tax=Zootermopsis nevadensis TaxID=136037 RepID=A0A067QQH1_ZOONE|nr:hypothetical protein L798_13823 [Zootermopsis nevadensis]